MITTIKQISKKTSVAVNCNTDKLELAVSIMNDLLKDKRMRIELTQQNRYNYDETGEGSLITLIEGDEE